MELAAMQRIVQRLFAKPVTSNQQLLALVVPQCEGKHTSQFLHALGSEFLIEVDDGLGVSMRCETMAVGFEFGPQLGKVVDFSIEYDPYRTIFVKNWLMAASKINDA